MVKGVSSGGSLRALRLPSRVLVSRGFEETLSGVVMELGPRPVGLFDPGLRPRLQALISEGDRGAGFQWIGLPMGEPSVSGLDSVAMKLSALQPTGLVAVGGGSAQDSAKALSIVRGIGAQSIWDFVSLSGKSPRSEVTETIPVVAVPTTAGSGAEVTPYAVIMNESLVRKGTIKSTLIQPVTAILDPSLSSSAPLSLRKTSAIDALCHGIESFLSRQNEDFFVEAVAIAAVSRLMRAIPKICQEDEAEWVATELAIGAFLAGLSISVAGTTAGHAFGESIGALIGVPHGVSMAVSIVPVLQATAEENSEKLGELAHQLGYRGKRARESLISAVEQIVSTADFRQEEIMEGFVDNLLKKVQAEKGPSLEAHSVFLSEASLKRIARRIASRLEPHIGS